MSFLRQLLIKNNEKLYMFIIVLINLNNRKKIVYEKINETLHLH